MFILVRGFVLKARIEAPRIQRFSFGNQSKNMISKILSKICGKRSKFSGDPSPSSNSPMNSMKIEEGNKRHINTVDDVISAPFSSLNIGNNLENKLPEIKNSQPNPNSVSASYEELPSFRDVPCSEKQDLFLRKIRICCVVFDFTDPTKNLNEKEIKRQTLLDIVEYMTTATGKFSELLMQEVVRMVSANIFREFTLQPRENKRLGGLDMEEDEPAMDPAWSHLQVVYEILLRFIASPETDAKVAKRSIDHSFVLKLLSLFDSEDPRERDYLKTILHRIYGKFMVHRPFIRKTINNILHCFIFETDRHNGVAEFLEVLGSIINGLSLPLKEEHKLFLVRTLIPLHKPKCLSVYHQQLSYCIMQFVEKDSKLADIVIRGLIKYWPVTNSGKEVLFLNEVEEVLEATQGQEFQLCMVALFRQISCSLNSLHFQVAERALCLWNNDHVENLMRQNCRVVLPIIFPALERNGRHHWNQSVHSLTLNVRKMFYDLDPDLFNACQAKFQSDELGEEEIKERRESIWRRLEEVAANKATSNAAVLIS